MKLQYTTNLLNINDMGNTLFQGLLISCLLAFISSN